MFVMRLRMDYLEGDLFLISDRLTVRIFVEDLMTDLCTFVIATNMDLAEESLFAVVVVP